MGGWASLAAAAVMPDGYRSIAIVGSSTGEPFAAPGTPKWPRNAAVIFSRYDEFAPFMWGAADARNVGSSAKMQALFGTDRSVEPGRVYGSLDDGTARWLATPTTMHPGDHISPAAIADAIAWMNLTLGNDTSLANGDQIWMWKEVGTLVALIGGVVLLLGTIGLLLSVPALAPAARGSDVEAPALHARSGLSLAVATVVPALSYFPLVYLGALFANVPLFPQNVTNQIMVWALGNGLIAAIVGWRIGAFRETEIGRKLAVALIAVTMLYGAVALSGVLFTSDLRFWIVALRPMANHHWPIFLTYLIPFTLFFYFSQRVLLGRVAGGFYSRTIVATVGGLALLLGVIYLWLFATGHVPPLIDPLFAIVLIQFVPVLAVTAIVAVFAWRRTGGALTGALVCGLLITWHVVAGQATHV